MATLATATHLDLFFMISLLIMCLILKSPFESEYLFPPVYISRALQLLNLKAHMTPICSSVPKSVHFLFKSVYVQTCSCGNLVSTYISICHSNRSKYASEKALQLPGKQTYYV